MKIYLNLLPEERKKEIREKKLVQLVIGQWTRLFFVILIFIGILLSFNFVLKIELDTIKNTRSFKESREEFKEISQYEETFKKINAQTTFLSNIQTSHLCWSRLLLKLNGTIPEKIFITGLTAKNYHFLITGKAETRDDLVKFQNTINKSHCFNNAEVPVSDFITKENIDFQIDIELNEECLIAQN